MTGLILKSNYMSKALLKKEACAKIKRAKQYLLITLNEEFEKMSDDGPDGIELAIEGDMESIATTLTVIMDQNEDIADLVMAAAEGYQALRQQIADN